MIRQGINNTYSYILIADTDLVAVWRMIMEYSQDGLTWGQSYKLEPVAYGKFLFYFIWIRNIFIHEK